MSSQTPKNLSQASEKQANRRTTQQNRALHKYYELLAQELNDLGLDMKKTLKPEIDIPWSGATVKQFLWKPVQKAQVLKEHTSELTTKEIDQIFDTITRHLGERFSVFIPFPSIEDLINYEDTQKL